MIPVLEDIIRGLLNGTMTHEQAELYLNEHLKLQAQVDAEDGPINHIGVEQGYVLMDLIKKCFEQQNRWGPRDYNNFDLGLASSADTDAGTICGYYGILSAHAARSRTDAKANLGELAWFDILLEEVAKLSEHHEGDPDGLRAQLIDVAGVATSWATALTVVPIEAHTMFEAGGVGDVGPRDGEVAVQVSEDDRRFGQPHYGHDSDQGTGRLA